MAPSHVHLNIYVCILCNIHVYFISHNCIPNIPTSPIYNMITTWVLIYHGPIYNSHHRITLFGQGTIIYGILYMVYYIWYIIYGILYMIIYIPYMVYYINTSIYPRLHCLRECYSGIHLLRNSINNGIIYYYYYHYIFFVQNIYV